MTVIRNSVRIACDQERAFDYLVDMRNEMHWNPRVESMEKVTAGPIDVGTRFRAKWKSSPQVDVDCVACQRPDSFGYHNGGPIEVRFAARLTPGPSGTRLDVDFDARPHGWFRLIFPLFLLQMRRAEAANMRYIQAALEGSGSKIN